jgi:hypothetical protein
MRRVLLVLGLILLPGLSSAQVKIPDEIVRQQMVSLIQSHPDVMCRMDMGRWIDQGKIKIWPTAPASDQRLLYLNMIADATGKLTDPALVVNPRFFLTTHLPPAQRIGRAVEMEKFGAILHEYTHLLFHFNGQYPLTTPLTSSTEQLAKLHWGSELEANWAEYKFLRRNGYMTVFFQGLFADWQDYPEWERFMLFFYDRLSNMKDAGRFKPYWGRYYKDEIKRPRR